MARKGIMHYSDDVTNRRDDATHFDRLHMGGQDGVFTGRRGGRVGLHLGDRPATDETGAVVGKGDVYAQTRAILDKLAAVLSEAGSASDRVVQTRVYITDVSRWEEVGRAHGEVFAGHGPALSLVHVKPFVDPDMLVEIEMVAAIGE